MVSFSLGLLISICVAKIIATAISIGFGFGGGVFSPALVIGAMLGGAYGTVFTGLFPDLSTGVGAYTILGMGAMAAAVLGAPISTALVIFEMTSDYALTLALMITVVISSMVTRQFHGGSFFSWQLERRGLDLSEGLEVALLRNLRVQSLLSHTEELVPLWVGLPDIRLMLQKSDNGELFVVDDAGVLFGTITLADMSEFAFDTELDHLITASDVARRNPAVLAGDEDLEKALSLMRDNGEDYISVVENHETMKFLGCVRQGRVMSAYNRALIESRRG
jgi:CIC family chloride channel protein